MAVLSNTETWSLVLGIVMPWLVAVVNRPWWSTRARQWVAVACAVVGGVLVCLSTGALTDLSDVVGSCAIVLVASQAVYGRLFATSQRTLERRTSGRHRAPEAVDAA